MKNLSYLESYILKAFTKFNYGAKPIHVQVNTLVRGFENEHHKCYKFEIENGINSLYQNGYFKDYTYDGNVFQIHMN